MFQLKCLTSVTTNRTYELQLIFGGENIELCGLQIYQSKNFQAGLNVWFKLGILKIFQNWISIKKLNVLISLGKMSGWIRLNY